MNGHLGDQVAAFVDGQLDFARREKALKHLSGCADCRAAVDQERWVKTRVQTLPGAEPSANLLSALTQVSTEPVPAAPSAPRPRPARGRPGLGRHGSRSALRHGGLLLAGAGSVAAGFLGLAYVVGGAAAQQDPVSPPVDRFSAEFAGSETSMPFADPAMDAFPVIGSRAPAGGR